MRSLRRLRNWASVFGRRTRSGGLAMLRPLRGRPTLLLGLGAFEVGTLLANRLDERLKILAHLRVASLVGCSYCLDAGSQLGRQAGLTEDQLAHLHRYETSDRFDDDERLVLDLSSALSATPCTIDDDLRARAAARFSGAELTELTTSIAWENYLARFNKAFGIAPAGFSSGACAARGRGSLVLASAPCSSAS